MTGLAPLATKGNSEKAIAESGMHAANIDSLISVALGVSAIFLGSRKPVVGATLAAGAIYFFADSMAALGYRGPYSSE